MKYSIPKNYDNKFEKDNMLFFVQRIEEMLFDYTRDLYKMPLLNIHGLVNEYSSVADKIQLGKVKEYQGTVIFEELVESLKNDIVLKEKWGIENIKVITDSFGSSGKEKVHHIINYLNAILDKNYYCWCKETLYKYLNEPREKDKMESIIRCLLPELVYLGYEPEYIYTTLKEKVFQKTDLSMENINNFFEMFNMKIHNYKVYFAISNVSLKFKEILENRLRFKFDDDDNFKNFRLDRDKVIVWRDNIKSLTPNGAIKSGYELIDLFFSFYKYVGNKKRFSIRDTAMAVDEEGKMTFIKPQKMYYNIVDSINFEEIGKASEALITGLLINAESEYALLSKSIEMHNTALAIPDLKSGFLNLWSSIEVISQTNDTESKIDNVMKIVIPILKKDYISEMVEDIYENIKVNIKYDSLKSILTKVEEEGCYKKRILYIIWLDKYKDLREELTSKLYDYPVIRYRIAQLSNISSTKYLREFIRRYEKRVTWHLYRMYRTRNGIIHSGEIPKNIKQLGEHLHSYVDSTVNEFAVKLSGVIPFSSVNDIIVDLEYANSNFEKMLDSDKKIDEDAIKTILHPELGYMMNCKEHQNI